MQHECKITVLEDPKYEGGKTWRYGWEDTFTIAKMWNEFDLKCAENKE